MKLFCLPVFIILVSLYSCQSPSTNKARITAPLTRSNYTSYVDAEGQLDAVRSIVLVSPRISYSAKVTWILPEGSRVGKDELVLRLEVDEIHNQYMTALDQLEIAKADAEKKYAELELQRLLYDTQYRNSMASANAMQLQLAKLEFEPPKIQEIKKLEIARYEVEAQQARRKMESLVKIQVEDRAHMELLIRQAQNKVDKFKENLSLLTINSPVNGIVIYEENWMTDEKLLLGDQVFPGMPLVKIPDMSVMQVRLQLGETEAQRVKKGQKAAITVPNLDNLILPGHVESVDNIARQVRRQSKVRKVEVVVNIDSMVQSLVPGLSARCRLETGFMKNVVSIPLDGIFEKDSVKLIYIASGKKYKPAPVAVISQDNDYAIIEGDFNGEEQIALLEPHESSINWPDTLIAWKVKSIPGSDSIKIAPDSAESKIILPVITALPILLKN